MEATTKAPQLVWDRGLPIWRATRAAVRAGFRPKRVNLKVFADNEAALVARCQRLMVEQNEWLSGRRSRDPVFDGTIGSAIRFWLTEPTSPYHRIEGSSRHPYDIYAGMIIETVGARRIDALDGRDIRRWHDAWSAPLRDGGKPRIAAARMAIIVLKNALGFAATCRKPGCAELRNILRDMRFATPRPRTEAPTASEVIAARKAAHDMGHAAAALAYALQFEGSMRQWDVVGKWVPLADKRPSSVIDGTSKWLGPMWAQIDENMILRYTPAKTRFTSGATVTLDLSMMPMVVEEMAKVPVEARRGPLIVNPRTGLPYRNWYYGEVWRRVRKIVGISKEVWNRDMRAAGVTEGRQAGAPTDDLAKQAGHANKRTTARVYDRDRLESARRVAKARVAHRERNGAGGVSQ
jgi:integrase